MPAHADETPLRLQGVDVLPALPSTALPLTAPLLTALLLTALLLTASAAAWGSP